MPPKGLALGTPDGQHLGMTEEDWPRGPVTHRAPLETHLAYVNGGLRVLSRRHTLPDGIERLRVMPATYPGGRVEVQEPLIEGACSDGSFRDRVISTSRTASSRQHASQGYGARGRG